MRGGWPGHPGLHLGRHAYLGGSSACTCERYAGSLVQDILLRLCGLGLASGGRLSDRAACLSGGAGPAQGLGILVSTG